MDSSLVNAVTNCGPVDKSKEWQMEMLMEKLRSKAGQFKSFFESAKALRMSLLEKRYTVDSMERNQLYKCLDTIQQNIKVTSLQAMVERLESVSRQLGLKFMAGPSGLDWFISSDMFYLEVVFESDDTVKDVKIHHEGKVEQQSCEELVACLTRHDFADFTAQLEGLASIYQLNAEKKVKCKAFSALASLEADLATLASLQAIIKEPFNVVHKSPVGVLQKRRGGHPMRLTYFVSPYDLLDPVNKCSKPLVVDNLDVGNSVTVCIEGSLSHKLQTSTLITVNSSGKNLVPVYGPLTNQNSTNLPACFVLRLSKPMPICVQLVRKIEQATEIECGDVSSAVPLLGLIVQHANLTASGSFEQVDNRGLFVVLPDQVHCYFMTENRQLDGIVVTSIPFTHPAHVPQILVYLRQQALLNAIITSCVRPSSNKQIDIEKVIMMEVTPLSYRQVSISLEHPIEESMATAELDLTDITNITCKTYNTSHDNHNSDYGTRVLQRSMSIPVTMRALIRSWQREANPTVKMEINGILGGGGPSGTGGGSGSGGGGNNLGGGGGTTGGSGTDHEINIKPDPDMMPTDCNQMITDSAESILPADMQPMCSDATNHLYNSVSMSVQPIVPEATVGEVSVSDVKQRDSPVQIERSNDDSLFSVLANGDKQINLNLPSSLSLTPAAGNESSNDNCGSDVGSNNSNSNISKKRKWKHISKDPDSEDDCEIVLETSSSNDSVGNVSSATASKEDVEPTNEPDVKIMKKSSGSGSGVSFSSASSSSTQSQQSPSSILLDLENKNLVPPSVSITPIPSTSSLERRPGIEIIPISSITITPITTTKESSGSGGKESSRRSSSKSSGSDEKERKRKRRKDESSSGMGPPSKQQDPLLKPVSVSIKPTIVDCGSPRPSSPSNSSGRTSVKPMKHSPNPVNYSSPKSSPKHSTASPGKPSMSALKSAVNSPKSDGSGSSKSSSKSASGKDASSKDKDRKSNSSLSGHVSPKLKSSVKLKQLDLQSAEFSTGSSNVAQSGSSTPPSGDNKSQPQPRNRKGSLSAVIDKLKSAQHCTDAVIPGGASSNDGNSVCSSTSKLSAAGGNTNSGGNNNNNNNNSNSKDRNISSGSKSFSLTEKGLSGNNKLPADKVPGSSEYILKHSSDGMKITINKTRTKDSSKSSSKSSGSSGSSSPKTHTGLKPGVISGPASKKPQQNSSSKSSSSSSSNKTSGNSRGSSKNVSSPSSTSAKNTKSSSSSAGKDKQRSALKSSTSSPSSSSSSSGASIFSSKSETRKSSPNAYRDRDRDRGGSDKEKSDDSKSSLTDLTAAGLMPSHLIVEGIAKPFDTSFQIPKLSARNANHNNNNNTSDSDYNSKKSDNNVKTNNNITTIDLPTLPLSTATTTTNNNKQLLIDSKSTFNFTATGGKVCDDLQSVEVSKLGLFGVESSVQSSISNPDVSLVTSSISKDDSIVVDSCSDGVDISSSTQSGPANSTGLTNAVSDLTVDPKKLINSAVTTSQEAAEILLDISASLPTMNKVNAISEKHLSGIVSSVASVLPLRKNTPPPPPPLPPPPLPPPVFPASPSVQVHIVKSPAPSPLIIPSPHSASPCITDDELMDEALVGIGK